MKQLLNFLKPKPAQPTIKSYGQTTSGVEQEQIQFLGDNALASEELANVQ